MDMGSRDEFGVGLRVSSTLKPTLVVTYLHTDITYVCISIIYYILVSSLISSLLTYHVEIKA